MKEVKIAAVSLTNPMNEPVGNYLYVDGIKMNIAEEEAADLINALPVDSLNEFFVDDLVPEELKNLKKLVEKD